MAGMRITVEVLDGRDADYVHLVLRHVFELRGDDQHPVAALAILGREGFKRTSHPAYVRGERIGHHQNVHKASPRFSSIQF